MARLDPLFNENAERPHMLTCLASTKPVMAGASCGAAMMDGKPVFDGRV